jgi:endonuclease/exonuclease/phosphatase family metal-dependent hydrolase
MIERGARRFPMRPTSTALVALVCFLCLSASRCSSPTAVSGGRSVSILAYNVKSLFDATDDGTEFEEFSVAKGRWDEAKYRIRLANVASAVFAAAGSPAGPDVLCLEEIENAKVLEALRAGPLASAHYRYAAIAPAEGGPFSNCALSRLPILSTASHAALTPSGFAGRHILELELDAGGERLCILSCHWKSKSGGAKETEEARREDAALVRSRVTALLAADPAAKIVVCGDLNESPDEFLRVGRAYPTALIPVEEAATETSDSARLLVAGARSLAVPLDGEVVLFSPWAESGGYSYSFRGNRERIDGFLLSSGLLEEPGLSYSSFEAASASILTDAEGEPIAWPGSGATGYSDHLPILLVLGPRGSR